MAFTLTTPEVVKSLRVSDQTLRRLRCAGVLRPGIHYRAIGTGTARPPLVWNLEAVDAELAKRSRRLLTNNAQG
jgi:hypothetical protein